MTVQNQLEELLEGWQVELWKEEDTFVLDLRRETGVNHVYRGSTLPNVVARAWAGEPSSKSASQKEAVSMPFPRDFYLPADVKNTSPETPEGTDLAIWKWTNPSGTLGAIAFAAKQNKPLWHYSFRNEADRERTISETVESRKSRMKMMQDRKDEKAAWQHSLKVGDILYSSWGYDQTNIDFYEVTAVAGKTVVIREIASNVVSGDGYSESVVAVPGKFIGPAMKKIPSKGYQGGSSIRLNSYSSANAWDGRPMHRTGPYGGH